MSEFPACAECGHRAWAHGNQSGFPVDGDPCWASVPGALDDCQCDGYRHPEGRP